MLNRIRSFFDRAADKNADGPLYEDRHMATAALLLEAAMMDGALDETEDASVRDLLDQHFDFSAEELDSLIEEAKERSHGSQQILGFTRAVKESCSYEERVALIEMLWEVTYADGVLHHYEANLLRRIGGLLYVSDKDNGSARKRVLDRLGIEA
ncbi:hypothetical protein JCM17846_31100 [Iodidimonas nitroreducens]|uniref:Co-chaperone DjlA N-terminal domain-containing protein n=2 Tax=Iodidimonas nitroreducens TaxID=1236968 RepID=A0A5A7NBE9_9PROT|nr:tellurite resistance protein [alpha proteobacterium Q-1]GER05428.1 hypothetical protein JCM17846_31100 [Iodidimonas nitroreducens]